MEAIHFQIILTRIENVQRRIIFIMRSCYIWLCLIKHLFSHSIIIDNLTSENILNARHCKLNEPWSNKFNWIVPTNYPPRLKRTITDIHTNYNHFLNRTKKKTQHNTWPWQKPSIYYDAWRLRPVWINILSWAQWFLVICLHVTSWLLLRLTAFCLHAQKKCMLLFLAILVWNDVVFC